MTQPYGAYPPAYPVTTSSGKATASLVTGIVSLVLCGLLTGIPAIVLGVMATKEIKRSGGQVSGGGLAIAGIVTGALGTLWSLAIIGFVVLALVVGGTSTSTCYSDGSSTHCSSN